MVHEIITSLDGVDLREINITYDNSENSPYSVKLPLSNEKFSCLQDKDLKVRQLKQKVIQGQYAQFYFIKKGFLYRSVVDNGHKFEVAVVPEDLIHTSFTFRSQSVWPQWISKNICHNQVCLLLERDEKNMYWFIAKVVLHVLNKGYKKHNLESKSLNQGHNQWSSFVLICIAEFYPPSSKGNRYALTAVCMLTGFTFCIPIKNKTAEEVVTAWRNHISFPFGVCRKLLTDNGTEFKNELFSQVAEQLGVERKIYTPPY